MQPWGEGYRVLKYLTCHKGEQRNVLPCLGHSLAMGPGLRE